MFVSSVHFADYANRPTVSALRGEAGTARVKPSHIQGHGWKDHWPSFTEIL